MKRGGLAGFFGGLIGLINITPMPIDLGKPASLLQDCAATRMLCAPTLTAVQGVSIARQFVRLRRSVFGSPGAACVIQRARVSASANVSLIAKDEPNSFVGLKRK
jgi:hypothetical protein